MERDDKGTLIIFEGIDGAGKTTQAARLAQWLKGEGWPVISFSEPTSGPYGRRLREIMHYGRKGITPQEELDLFLKDREEDVRANILPALKQSYVIIMDRYYYSNMAYQGALGIDVKAIETLNEKIAPRPDAVFILEVDVQLGLHRINTLRQEKENHFEKAEYLKRVSHLFSQMRGENIYHVKASLPVEKVNAQIDPIVLDLLQRHQGRLASPGP